MKKTYEEARKALEALEGGSEFLEAIDAKLTKDVDTEKQRGITEKKKVDSEAKSLRDRLKKVTEPLGLDPESDDFDTQVGEYKTLKEKGVVKPNVQTAPEFVQLKKDFDKLNADLKVRADKETAQRDKAIKAQKRAALTKAMTEKKVIPEFMDDLLIALDGRVLVDDDDNVTWKGEAEGETFTVEDGLGKFLEKKANYVANSQNPGGGGGPGAGGGSGQPKNEPTTEERRTQLNGMMRSFL